MVKLEEVLDEEFNREQAGPQVEDEWDTSDGTNCLYSTTAVCARAQAQWTEG